MEAQFQEMIDFVASHYQRVRPIGSILERILREHSAQAIESACGELLSWILLREVLEVHRQLRLKIVWPQTQALIALIGSSEFLSAVFEMDANGTLDYREVVDKETRDRIHRYVRENFHPEVIV